MLVSGSVPPHEVSQLAPGKMVVGRRSYDDPFLLGFGNFQGLRGKLREGTLQGTNISPKNGILKMMFLFRKVGYVNSLEGICLTTWSPLLCLPEVLKKVSTASAVEQFEKARSGRTRNATGDAETEEVVWN